MNDLIKREDAIKAIEETPFIRRPILPHYLKAKINQVSSAENKGEWIFVGNSIEPMWECSECGENEFGSKSKLTNFCPHCGARMKGADDERL